MAGKRKTTTCSVEGCDAGGYMTRGLCQMHYARLRRQGSTGGTSKMHAVSWAGKTCAIDGCDSPVQSRGYCSSHYRRLLQYEDPLGSPARQTEGDRFWAKVDRRGPEDCWFWTAGAISSGYGGFHPAEGETILAHRYTYELAHGAGSAAGRTIDHTCHNDQECPPGPCEHRLCCNPAHLEAVTNRVNVNRSHNSNIRKTHCPKGHPYTPENTRIHVKPNSTGRSCMECARERDRQPHRNAAVRRRRYQQQKAA